MKVEAELKELYKVTIGHDGYTSGCGYDGSDMYSSTHYGETLRDCALLFSKDEEYVLMDNNTFNMLKVEAIIYNGTINTVKVLDHLHEYGDNKKMIAERDEFNRLLKFDEETKGNIKNILDAKKEKDRIKKELAEKEEKEKKEQSERAQLEILKLKYDNY